VLASNSGAFAAGFDRGHLLVVTLSRALLASF
jgi:hypothetical protein